jgi:hypothetical protein
LTIWTCDFSSRYKMSRRDVVSNSALKAPDHLTRIPFQPYLLVKKTRARVQVVIYINREMYQVKSCFLHNGMVGDGGSFAGGWIPPNLVAAFCIAIKNKSGISEIPYNLSVLESRERLFRLFSLRAACRGHGQPSPGSTA